MVIQDINIRENQYREKNKSVNVQERTNQICAKRNTYKNHNFSQ